MTVRRATGAAGPLAGTRGPETPLAAASPAAVAVYLYAWAIFTTYMFIASHPLARGRSRVALQHDIQSARPPNRAPFSMKARPLPLWHVPKHSNPPQLRTSRDRGGDPRGRVAVRAQDQRLLEAVASQRAGLPARRRRDHRGLTPAPQRALEQRTPAQPRGRGGQGAGAAPAPRARRRVGPAGVSAFTPLTGGCNCGAVRFEVTEPL